MIMRRSVDLFIYELFALNSRDNPGVGRENTPSLDHDLSHIRREKDREIKLIRRLKRKRGIPLKVFEIRSRGRSGLPGIYERTRVPHSPRPHLINSAH